MTQEYRRRRAFGKAGVACFAAAILGIALAAPGAHARARLVTRSQLPLHTQGRWIVDNGGKRVKFACVNWSGAAQKDGVVGGLQHQAVDAIAHTFAAMGFNCVRIPWSVEMVLQPHDVHNSSLLAANPALMGSSTLELLDAVVDACAGAQLMVIMDQNGLWYNDRWSEADWIAAHLLIARRYEGSPYVVAGELRNELRSSVVGGTRLTPQWPSTDGPNDNRTDWPAAALRASSAILEARPTGYLIVVDGLSFSTDFTGVYSKPLALPVPNRLVYSAHDYSWSQKSASKAELVTLLGNRWGYLLKQGQAFTAPVWVSEFGTPHDGSQIGDDKWWGWFVDYLRGADMDFGYWRGDGTESRGTGRTFGAPAWFGILNSTWNGPAEDGVLLKALQPLQAATQGPGTAVLPAST